MIKKPLVNNQIRASQVRLVDETGKQLGVVSFSDAIKKSHERNLDLIQVTEKVEPPVCKIMDYGKYLYHLQKKERGGKKSSETKGIRLSFNISPHDLETRAIQTEGFLKKGNRVRIEMILRGREKGHSDFAKEKIKMFINILEKRIPIKAEGELRKEPRGFTMVITKA